MSVRYASRSFFFIWKTKEEGKGEKEKKEKKRGRGELRRGKNKNIGWAGKKNRHTIPNLAQHRLAPVVAPPARRRGVVRVPGARQVRHGAERVRQGRLEGRQGVGRRVGGHDAGGREPGMRGRAAEVGDGRLEKVDDVGVGRYGGGRPVARHAKRRVAGRVLGELVGPKVGVGLGLGDPVPLEDGWVSDERRKREIGSWVQKPDTRREKEEEEGGGASLAYLFM